MSASRNKPPFVCQAKGKIFVNIGCLGIDSQSDDHNMVLMSVYDGSGPLNLRTKVESLSM